MYRVLVIVPLLVCLAGADTPPAPKVPLGKDTTFFTAPLDKEGFVDYETALNKELGKGVTPENNAVVLLFKALGPRPEGGTIPPDFFKTLGIEEPAEKGDYFISLPKFLREQRQLPQAKIDEVLAQRDDWAMKRPWRADDYPHLTAWLQANEKPLTLVVEATRRREYFYPLISRRVNDHHTGLISSLLSGVQTSRELIAALAMRAQRHIGEERYDDAWQDLLAGHRLARLVSRGATAIESLVGIAIEKVACNADLVYLQHAKLDAAQIRARLAELQALPPLAPLADKIDLGERLIFLDALQSVHRCGPDSLKDLREGQAPPVPAPAMRRFLDSVDWEPGYRECNLWYDRLARIARIKDRDSRIKEFQKVDVDIKTMKKKVADKTNLLNRLLPKDPPAKTFGKDIGEILIGLMTPAMNSVQGAYDRIEQSQRNLQVAFALAAYQRDEGHYPAKLADLSRKYLPAVPNDLFSGKDLIYRPADKGYLLYSVGSNGVDEQGRSRDDDPAGDDETVRMPLPELPKPK